MRANQNVKMLPVRKLAICLSVAVAGLLTSFLSVVKPGQASSSATPGKLDLSLAVIATGLNDPVGVTNAGPGDDRLFVVERAGRIKIVRPDGSVLPTPFLDIAGRVDASATEEGLLGLVFHPNYAGNGYFYVNYTNTTSGIRRTRISRFRVTGNADVADANSEETLFTVTQPFSNHNAGDIHFGPDGYLYVPLGDGGSGGDPNNNAQSLGTLLGKVIRIDVDSGPGNGPDCQGTGSGNYTVPLTNPWIDGNGGSCDEIWATGLRNPWRSSFDRRTGDFFIGDVGQNLYEEIDFQPAASTGSENYGWRCYEGNHAYNLSGCGPASGYTFPIFEYNNPGEGCSVAGGYVYRGSRYPFMVGHYLLTDYCSGNFWDLLPDGDNWSVELHTNLAAFGYVSFGEDAAGELYVVNRSDGTISQVEENTTGPLLTIDKRGPLFAGGSAITYTITVTNSGNLTATNLIISDTIPAGATYIPGSGGVQVGPVVRWTVSALAPFDTAIQTTFAVTATQTTVNTDYRVTADGGIAAVGSNSVRTIRLTDSRYLPIVRKE